jgi:hypothetical protein
MLFGYLQSYLVASVDVGVEGCMRKSCRCRWGRVVDVEGHILRRGSGFWSDTDT